MAPGVRRRTGTVVPHAKQQRVGDVVQLDVDRGARRVPARLLGVALSSLTADADADQLTLFEARDARLVETDRDRRLARAVDRVRAKFGDRGIVPGGLV